MKDLSLSRTIRTRKGSLFSKWVSPQAVTSVTRHALMIFVLALRGTVKSV
jgi:hypothetical protein